MDIFLTLQVDNPFLFVQIRTRNSSGKEYFSVPVSAMNYIKNMSEITFICYAGPFKLQRSSEQLCLHLLRKI